MSIGPEAGEVLLQGIGRLHRHGRPDRGSFSFAHAEILVPAARDLGRYLGRVRDRHGLGPLADGSGIYPELIALEATWRIVEGNGAIEIPRDNRRLVEGALHSEVLERLEHELGTVAGAGRFGFSATAVRDSASLDALVTRYLTQADAKLYISIRAK